MVTISVSPCPNDTFAFYHFLNLTNHQKNEVTFEDIQKLNERAIAGSRDVLKISFAVYPLIQEEYVILDSGAALGQGCGPLLISKKPIDLAAIQQLKIALPGINTSANRLFRHIFPNCQNVIYTTYEKVMSVVESGVADAGVIIHENRFTYQKKGFLLAADLGEMWAQKYHQLLPLGGIVAKRSLGMEKINQISNQIATSIQWAFENFYDPQMRKFIEKYAQELNTEVIDQHIKLYVNEYSIHLTEKGRKAILSFLSNDINKKIPCFATDLIPVIHSREKID